MNGLKKIIVITPTYHRSERFKYLQRMAGALRSVKNLLWIIVEDGAACDELVKQFLEASKIEYVYLNFGPTRRSGNAQRDHALNYVKSQGLDGIVYLADDDNYYTSELFEEIRQTTRVGILPVGNLGPNGVERPVVKNGKIVDWVADRLMRKYPVDMAAMVFHTSVLDEIKGPIWPYKSYGSETYFLESFVKSQEELESLCDDCTRCLVWHNVPLGEHPVFAMLKYRIDRNLQMPLQRRITQTKNRISKFINLISYAKRSYVWRLAGKTEISGVVILGGGMTGLAAGYNSGIPVYEAAHVPGGLAATYYMRPKETKRRLRPDGKTYRFELGGGHWIFGGDLDVLEWLRGLTPMRSYSRRSSVFFAAKNLYVPYPLQNHLRFLDPTIAQKAIQEMESGEAEDEPQTMREWLKSRFGPTLFNLFFGPFHSLYTAGLDQWVAPQDGYKSPVDIQQVKEGAAHQAQPAGYNTTFLYPEDGLNALAREIAKGCRLRTGKKVVRIDPELKKIFFEDGSETSYRRLISTLPLNKMMELTELSVEEQPDPYTSVLVLNIGAIRGEKCPDDHWIYVPDSVAGFHRIGFYSNVDPLFLPASFRSSKNRVSLYVERAFANGVKLSAEETVAYRREAIRELQEWKFIEAVEVDDLRWIEVAYTWSTPGSRWREKAIQKLAEVDIHQTGRFGRWVFQGIAASIRDGLDAPLTVVEDAPSFQPYEPQAARKSQPLG